MIANFLNASWTFLQRMFNRAFDFLGDLLGYLFQKLFDFFKWLLQPIFIVIGIVFYVLYKLGVLVVTLLQVLLAVGKLFFAFVKGIFATLAGLTYTSSARSDGQWTSIFNNVVSGLDGYQLDVLAYVLLFLVWFATGWAAIRILSSMRFGGD